VAVGWGELHEQLHNMYSSSEVIRMIKSRRMRETGHVARITKTRKAYNISMKGIDHLEYLGVYGKIILNWV
jgi:hypothetical protein